LSRISSPFMQYYLSRHDAGVADSENAHAAAANHGAAAQVRDEVPPQVPKLRESPAATPARHRVRQIHHPSEIIGGVGAEFLACDFFQPSEPRHGD
jgi:hypothetical protein